MAYALIEARPKKSPPVKTQKWHVCGEKLVPVPQEKDRYSCPKCLMSGYLLKAPAK